MICNFPVWSDDTGVFDHYNRVLTVKNKVRRKEIDRERDWDLRTMWICLFAYSDQMKSQNNK